MSQSQAALLPLSTQRLPLSTLSFTSDITSPSQRPKLARLKRGRRRSPSTEGEGAGLPSTRSQSPSARPNAFSLLLASAQKEKKKRKLEKSEFVEGEAVESDDDEMLGFGPRTKRDDEDSEDDDLDASVENLVDDAQMDEETIAEDKILEKHK